MKIVATLFALTLGSTALAAETRCGWIENPTPANISLLDKDAEWIIGAQGGHQAEGDVVWPTDYDNNYVATNYNYGYFCGCIRSENNPVDKTVLKILSAKALPLSRCLADKNIPQDFRPRTLIHSVGKAYTECQDADEILAGFKGRKVCINVDGDYYFIAD